MPLALFIMLDLSEKNILFLNFGSIYHRLTRKKKSWYLTANAAVTAEVDDQNRQEKSETKIQPNTTNEKQKPIYNSCTFVGNGDNLYTFQFYLTKHSKCKFVYTFREFLLVALFLLHRAEIV